MSIIPQGSKLIVLPLPKENFVTEGNLEIIDNNLITGKVVEVSKEWEGVYQRGDIVIFSEKAGTGLMYQGKPHLYLNGKSHSDNGDIWAIETNDIQPKDKGDSL